MNPTPWLKCVVYRYEEEMSRLEERVKRKEEEKNEVENKLDQVDCRKQRFFSYFWVAKCLRRPPTPSPLILIPINMMSENITEEELS